MNGEPMGAEMNFQSEPIEPRARRDRPRVDFREKTLVPPMEMLGRGGGGGQKTADELMAVMDDVNTKRFAKISLDTDRILKDLEATSNFPKRGEVLEKLLEKA